ncbi:hypothetical protein EV660_108146 [Roseinatronobacter bogoriensis DSM 18756]|nr:hypothetical protein [Rhodobaca bogoriensis DSM 18756]TDY67143.1 hypothetical protein EV660_108146 [Rhodobaca bogoriensis DSM 18756]
MLVDSANRNSLIKLEVIHKELQITGVQPVRSAQTLVK